MKFVSQHRYNNKTRILRIMSICGTREPMVLQVTVPIAPGLRKYRLLVPWSPASLILFRVDAQTLEFCEISELAPIFSYFILWNRSQYSNNSDFILGLYWWNSNKIDCEIVTKIWHFKGWTKKDFESYANVTFSDPFSYPCCSLLWLSTLRSYW